MNWNSIVRAGSAMAIYIALVGSHLAGFSPLEFALYSALLLALGLTLHSAEPPSPKAIEPFQAVIPSLSESMIELHSLQTDINELQAQFAAESSAGSTHFTSGGSAS